MARGASDVPSLRLETIQKFVTNWMANFTPVLSGMFATSPSPSSTIKWEGQVGSRGMAPFKAPGSPTPTTYPMGISQSSAEAAFWGEKMYFDEEYLNNLRKEGTESDFLSAQQRLAREMSGLVNRVMRRKEFMFAKMLEAGAFTYNETGGTKISVDYDIPSANSDTLTTDYKWENGTKRDIVNDVIDAKKVILDACNGVVTDAICTSTVFKYMAQDSNIQTVLQKTSYGDGNLFKGNRNYPVGANPAVISDYLGIPNLIIYDEKYETKSYLTAAVTGASTTVVTVANPADFTAGETLRFVDVSAGSYEDETIASVQVEDGTITVSTAPTASFKAGEDYVLQRSYFIPDNKIIFMARNVDGNAIVEYKQAPYGNNRKFGLSTKRWETEDPEGVYIRVEDKGLPVLYQRDAIYQLTVN